VAPISIRPTSPERIWERAHDDAQRSPRRGVAASIAIALALLAAVAATAFGFWTGSGQRLLKLEAALALAALGLVVVALASLRGAGSSGTDTRSIGPTPFVSLAAALLSMAAALIHFAVIKEHLDEYWLYGVFFVVVAPGQLSWALLVLWRPSRFVCWLGAIGNAAIAVFFVITRTIGTLIGPEASEPVRLGFGDTVATAYEVGVVLVAWSLLTGLALRPGRVFVSRAGAGALLGALVMPQTALALQSAVSSAPFVPPAG
jgi:hypothetical protein